MTAGIRWRSLYKCLVSRQGDVPSAGYQLLKIKDNDANWAGCIRKSRGFLKGLSKEYIEYQSIFVPCVCTFFQRLRGFPSCCPSTM